MWEIALVGCRSIFTTVNLESIQIWENSVEHMAINKWNTVVTKISEKKQQTEMKLTTVQQRNWYAPYNTHNVTLPADIL